MLLKMGPVRVGWGGGEGWQSQLFHAVETGMGPSCNWTLEANE